MIEKLRGTQREMISGEQSVKIRRVKRRGYEETERETEQRAEMKKFSEGEETVKEKTEGLWE